MAEVNLKLELLYDNLNKIYEQGWDVEFHIYVFLKSLLLSMEFIFAYEQQATAKCKQ